MKRVVLSFAAALAAAPLAHAAEPTPGIDFTQALAGLDHKPLSECKEVGALDKDGKPTCAKTGPVTLGEVAAASLMVPDRAASLDDQVKRARLAQRVVDGKSVSLTAEDTALIKGQVAKLGLSPIIVLDLVTILDPASLPK